jgi:hypothetical protein
LSSHLLHRLALVAVALVAVTWLGLSLRAAVLEADGRDALARGSLTRDELASALNDLDGAGFANIGSGPRLVEARLLAADGRPGAALTVAEGVAADEPENLEAWALVYIAARATKDDERAERSFAAIRELNPQLADRIARGS